MFVCMYIKIYTYAYIYIYMYMCVYIHRRRCGAVALGGWNSVRIYIMTCMYRYIYCMYVYTYSNMYVRIYTCAYLWDFRDADVARWLLQGGVR